nr:helix-turn-helix domain-containing protein [Nocardia vinacea]
MCWKTTFPASAATSPTANENCRPAQTSRPWTISLKYDRAQPWVSRVDRFPDTHDAPSAALVKLPLVRASRNDSSVSSIARLLGVSRSTIYKYLPELGPDRPPVIEAAAE